MEKKNLRFQIPSVDKVLNDPHIIEATAGLPRPAVVNAIRTILQGFRLQIRAGQRPNDKKISMEELAPLVSDAARRNLRPAVKKVINATGIVIHTNLGRAPMAQNAVEAMETIATGYSDLEFDLEAGHRGSRAVLVESLAVVLTGAEDALVVNNNAAAVFLILAAFAKEKEVVVSRGELIEIGGSFRLPEIMAASGCILREVGTTNKTHLSDYERALSDDTALILKVHTSNYKVLGFTSEVPLDELAAIGQKSSTPVVEDLGSGSLINFPGLDEPTVAHSVKAGADLVTFSGDKMLGGPQCGFIVGNAEMIQALKTHPIYRALRLDKITLAALEATLKLYLHDNPKEKIPVLGMICRPLKDLKEQATKLRGLLSDGQDLEIELVETQAKVGGGSLPNRELPSWALKLKSLRFDEDALARALREGDLPIVARVEKGAVLLDMMTIVDADLRGIAEAIESVVSK